MAKPKDRKPKKPTRNCPLFPHSDGTWKPTKAINGKRPSFGSWVNDRKGELALKRYHDWEVKGQATAPTPTKTIVPGAIAVKDLFNEFLLIKEGQMRQGELEPRTYQDYRDDLHEFAALVGPDRRASELGPADFRKVREVWEKRMGPHALNRHVQNIRAAFRAAGPEEMRLLLVPPHYGGEFRRVPIRARRRARRESEQEHGKRILSPEEVRAILKAAEQPLKACVLLGLNCGFLAIDCARLNRAAVDLEDGFIEFHRQKTENFRAAVLWPETVTAIREVIDNPRQYRKPLRDPAHAELVFLTRNRWPLVREKLTTDAEGTLTAVAHNDSLSQSFYELLKDLGIKGKGKRLGLNFSALRKTHRTYADEVGDTNAARVLMGHVVGSGAEEFYVRSVARERLKKVTDHVRSKLLLKARSSSAVPASSRRPAVGGRKQRAAPDPSKMTPAIAV